MIPNKCTIKDYKALLREANEEIEAREKHIRYLENKNQELSEENSKLKDLLKECQNIFKEQHFYRNTPIETDITYRTRCLKKQELLTKIEEALK